MSFRTLIVDDDSIIIFIHKKLVGRCGFPVAPETYLNGREALDNLMATADADTRTLVLLDINMPVMSGWEFLDAIQDQPFANHMKVAMVTSSVDASDKLKAKTYPQVVGFLEKPISVDMLNDLRVHVE
jgi:CheY-like chemotaxis protein